MGRFIVDGVLSQTMPPMTATSPSTAVWAKVARAATVPKEVFEVCADRSKPRFMAIDVYRAPGTRPSKN